MQFKFHLRTVVRKQCKIKLLQWPVLVCFSIYPIFIYGHAIYGVSSVMFGVPLGKATGAVSV